MGNEAADRKKVLIVDDELDMRIFMATLFETRGYRPIVVKNGKEGIRKAREEKPDLIVLDVMMPGEGGVQMYRQLKTDDALKAIPVLMLTAVGEKSFHHYLSMLSSRLQAAVPLPDGYLEKPPDPAELLRIAEKFLS